MESFQLTNIHVPGQRLKVLNKRMNMTDDQHFLLGFVIKVNRSFPQTGKHCGAIIYFWFKQTPPFSKTTSLSSTVPNMQGIFLSKAIFSILTVPLNHWPLQTYDRHRIVWYAGHNSKLGFPFCLLRKKQNGAQQRNNWVMWDGKKPRFTSLNMHR